MEVGQLRGLKAAAKNAVLRETLSQLVQARLKRPQLRQRVLFRARPWRLETMRLKRFERLRDFSRVFRQPRDVLQVVGVGRGLLAQRD